MRSIFEYCAYHARMTPRLGPVGCLAIPMVRPWGNLGFGQKPH